MRKAKLPTFLATLVLFILYIIPFYLLVLNTFKTSTQFTANPFSLPGSLHFENYVEAVQRMDFFSAFRNSMITTVVTTLVNVLLASMTAYVFNRKKWRINKILMMVMVSSMVAPFQVYMIPLVRIFGGYLNLTNNLLAVAYIAIGLNFPFAVFLIHGFMNSIPRELDEAALVDGCSTTRTFFSIILPLLKPILITVMVFVALAMWNDYLMSSLFLTRMETRTLPIAAFTFLTYRSAEYSPMMAGLVLSTIPVLVFYIIGQKYIIEGVVQGSVKG